MSTVLILALALASGFAFFRRAFSRRFQLILQGITKIAGGDFRPPFQLEWADELGQLAQAFDEMCRRLLVRETELSQLREKLALSSKLAALGEMAAGVAHQIRNPLVVMKVSAEMLRDNYTVTGHVDRYQKLTSLMIDEADTLNLVVSNFLDFARPRKINRSPASISAIIDFCLESLPLERFQGVSVRRVVEEGVPELPLDRNLIGAGALQPHPERAPGISRLRRVGGGPRGHGGRAASRGSAGLGRGNGRGDAAQHVQPVLHHAGVRHGPGAFHRAPHRGRATAGIIDVRSAPGQGSTFGILL